LEDERSGGRFRQVTAMGPLGLEYLSAKDDPRNNNSKEESEQLLVGPKERVF
jgi:hypothetical protein